ncbi:DTW domain-containing protein [Cellvibrio sp. PSBB023]|uniref:DTW domain-containing protein n=1 Tax=Cellvibrio sp. PSBB023 TaxID=1945512 RepID=UPI001AEF5389|nr:tRNA-uridine aminocarboxypropyltransferase [Cellvibrio sp. PSBB023]
MNKPLHIILLTHERELHRKTNTGSIALQLASELVERIVWSRTAPSQHLLEQLANQQAVLLYPSTESTRVNIADIETVIIIDSTWQEAQKIVNKSPYLQCAPKATLSPIQQSSFALRRNQIAGGLCTIECIIELCNIKGLHDTAEKLIAAFEQHNQK